MLGRTRLVRSYESDIDERELYDLKRDPRELTSICGNHEYTDIQTNLKKQLQNLRDQLKVPAPDSPESHRGGVRRYQDTVEQ